MTILLKSANDIPVAIIETDTTTLDEILRVMAYMKDNEMILENLEEELPSDCTVRWMSSLGDYDVYWYE